MVYVTDLTCVTVTKVTPGHKETTTEPEVKLQSPQKIGSPLVSIATVAIYKTKAEGNYPKIKWDVRLQNLVKWRPTAVMHLWP